MNALIPIAYASLAQRFRALMIDGLALAAVLVLSIWLVVLLGLQDHSIAPYLGLGPAILIDPLLVAYTGGSVGHHATGLRIRQLAADCNVGFLPALLRFVIKTCLGWLSLVFVLTTKHHQGIHDLVSRTIVIHKNAAAVHPHEVITERKVEEVGYLYPSPLRRVAVTLGYLLLGFIIYCIAAATLFSEECLMRNRCQAPADSVLILVLGAIWIISVFVTCAKGWTGKLPGARRRTLPQHE